MTNLEKFEQDCAALRESCVGIVNYLRQDISTMKMVTWDIEALLKKRDELQVELEEVKNTIASAKKEADSIVADAKKRAEDSVEVARRESIDATIQLNNTRKEIDELEAKRYKLKDGKNTSADKK